MRTPYTNLITRLVPDHDPRHVEAWMRIEYGTLDHLGPTRFRAEVRTAITCIAEAGRAESEDLALSFGL